MKLITGLGNPEKKYIKTRHNIGFRILDAVINSTDFEDFKFQDSKKFFGQVAKNSQILLLKPMTYMNKSGQSVLAIKKFFNIDLDEILIVHDDMDINFGQIKLQKNKSAAGHNGVDSIIDALGSKDFWRLRIGINTEIKNKLSGDKFVIANFTKTEEKLMPLIIELAVKIIKEFMTQKSNQITNKNFKIPV